jgi:cobalt-zinc-cadmium efflux system protein
MSGHGHGHGHTALGEAGRRALTGALALIVGFLLVEVVVGVLAGSVALLSDAAHMLTDAAAIALALAAARLARRPAEGRMTYGWRRVEILAAQANGLTLLLLGAWLGYESVRRLISPAEVAGGLVLVTALTGVVVNLAATLLLSRADRTSLNVEGAFQHVLNDLFAFIAAAVAGLVVLLTGWDRADPIASLVVVVLMLRAGVGLVRESGRILIEAAPAGLDPDEIGIALHDRPHVTEVHDLHVWEITSASPALSAHVLVEPGADCHAVRLDLVQVVGERYGITHITLQVDHDGPSGHHAVVPLTLGSASSNCHSDDCEQH